MFNEKWDVLDENGRRTGKTTLRRKCILKSDEYHLVVHIWIVSTDGRVLLQRRSEHKKLMPGEWAATGGAAVSGEDSFTAAKRELHEELGIRSDEQSLKKLSRIKRRNSLVDMWAITVDPESCALKLQKSEVAEAKWITLPEFKNMIENKQFHNYGKEYFDTLFSELEKMNTVLA
ncbi:MAG: NUDIX domain-containing protein [Clostridia bacterium]|nr:NUDIX domain-containing protein [Clostridia bacterium]